MPTVAEDCRALQALCTELERVLRKEEWTALARVDQAIREQLLALGRQPGLSAEAERARQRLQRLHAEACQACAAECERLRCLLLSHLEYAEGRSAYRQVSGS